MNINYSAIDITNYILYYSIESGDHIPISHLRVQLLLYYTVVNYYQRYGHLLYEEDIEKWEFGPVTPSVYHTFKNWPYNSHLSPTVEVKRLNNKVELTEYSPNIDEDYVAHSIECFIDILGYMETRYLVEKVRSELAWQGDKDNILGSWNAPKYSLNELKEAYTLNELIYMYERGV